MSSQRTRTTGGKTERVRGKSAVAQGERRERILDATVSLASSGGFDAVQMREVAERADVALGTLYRYFPSKIHLLVSALHRQLERANEASLKAGPIAGDTAADRVINVLRELGGGIGSDPHLTEALTRAFMFADSSVQQQIHEVGELLVAMLTRAFHPEDPQSTPEDVARSRVIADVWLATLVGWVTGRRTLEDAIAHLEHAVRLLMSDSSA